MRRELKTRPGLEQCDLCRETADPTLWLKVTSDDENTIGEGYRKLCFPCVEAISAFYTPQVSEVEDLS